MSLDAIQNIAAGNAAAVAAVTGTATAITPNPAAQPAPAAVTPPAPAAPVQAAAPVGITLTPEQWAAYSTTNARIAELEAAEQSRVAAAKDAEIKALQAKGQIEQAFALQRQQAEATIEVERKARLQTEERAKRYALDGELARSLASQPLVAGGAEQLTQLWRSQLSVEPQGYSFAVQAPGFQPVGAWIAAQLGRPEYSHFLRAQNPLGGTAGGPPGTQGAPTAPAQTAAVQQPANMSEAVLMQIAAQQRSTADPRMTGATQANADGSYTRQRAEGFGLRPFHPVKTA